MNPKSGRTWINFKELRSKLRFEDVLRHYGVEVSRKGNQHLGRCPLPGHGAVREMGMFSAELERGIFQCFGCRASGNVLDFGALMEGVDPNKGTELRKVAVRLEAALLAPAAVAEPSGPVQTELPTGSNGQAVVVNAPLDFELKGLDPGHAYPSGRGFQRETMSYFGVGFCSRGSLKDRVAIPLHSEDGKLMGYAGRSVDPASISPDSPRYVFPEERERKGTVLRFDKHLLLYNAHRIRSPVDDLIVVEGFTSVWWLHQHGPMNVVATMGTELSSEQCDLVIRLLKPGGRLWAMPDQNEPGKRLGQAILSNLSPHRFVRWVQLRPEEQPTDLSAAEIQACLSR